MHKSSFKDRGIPVSQFSKRQKTMAAVETYNLGDWALQSGQSIPDAQIAYKTFGDPKSPAIIYPSWYSGCKFTHQLSRSRADDSK